MQPSTKRFWLVLLMALVLGSACASHRYTVQQPVSTKLGSYKTVEVLPFTTSVDNEAGRRVADDLPDTLACVFTDKASVQQIELAGFDGELSGGLFGGSSGGAAEGVVKAVRDYLRDNY